MASYIENVLFALRKLSTTKIVVSRKEIEKLSGELTNKQFNVSLVNFRKLEGGLIKDIGAGQFQLNLDKIDYVFREYKAGTYKLWYDSNGQKKTRTISYHKISNQYHPNQNHTSKSLVFAIIAAYPKPLTVYDIQIIAEKTGYELNYKTVNGILSRTSKKFFTRGKFGRKLTFAANELFFVQNDCDYLCEIYPLRENMIRRRFHQYVGTDPFHDTKSEPEQTGPEATAEATSNDDIKQEVIENTDYIEAAQVGAAIVAYINKLKKKGAQIDPTEYEALQKKYDDQSQAIINLRNQLLSAEGQVAKLKKMTESQNKTIIDLTHSVEVLKREKLERERIPSTFKLSEVANIKRMIKG